VLRAAAADDDDDDRANGAVMEGAAGRILICSYCYRSW